MTPEVIILHHTAVAGDNRQYFAVDRYHKSLGFPLSTLGRYVGYQFFVEKDGTTFQARRQDEIGAHTIGWNDKSIGICLAGNFNYEIPTPAQLRALGRLTERLKLPVDLHKNRQSNRTCPGENLTLDLLPIQDEVDDSKQEMIEYYMSKYPRLINWILSLIK